MPPLKPDTRPAGATHDNSLPQWAVDKMTRRRGRRYAYETIDPEKTALIVIDLMPSYISGTPCASSIVAPITRIAESLRAAGGIIAWVLPAPISLEDPTLKALWGEEHLRETEIGATSDSFEAGLAEGLSPHPQDLKVRKSAASAFFPGKSPLPELLAARGIETVVISGVLTNICCESSARDAATLGYQVILVADATAARSDAEHQSALYNILRNFGDVRMSDDLIALIGRGR